MDVSSDTRTVTHGLGPNKLSVSASHESGSEALRAIRTRSDALPCIASTRERAVSVHCQDIVGPSSMALKCAPRSKRRPTRLHTLPERLAMHVFMS